jgi:hypothetical protein
MARWAGRSAPDARPPEQAFRELLAETLRPVLERHPPADIEVAQRILTAAVDRIEAEILLVEPSAGPRAGRGRARSRRRPT